MRGFFFLMESGTILPYEPIPETDRDILDCLGDGSLEDDC
jgi:hypothetical protein